MEWISWMFENPRRGRQARNFTTNFSKILVLKSSSEQMFFRKLSLGDICPCNAANALRSTVTIILAKKQESALPRMSVQGTTSRKLRHPWAKNQMFLVRISLKKRAGGSLFLLFPTFLLFPIHCFLYTLLPSPWDKLEFLGQILIKWNVRYWLNTSLFYFDTWFKQQRNASYDISK